MSVQIRDFLKNRRDRALGTILGNAEKDVWPKLSPAEREAFRRIVVGAIDAYHDSVLDLVKAEDGIRNDEVIDALRRIESNTKPRVRPDIGPG